MKKVNILGTEYTLEELTEAEDSNLKGVDGYCDTSVKQLIVEPLKPTGTLREKKNLAEYKKMVTRHEIIHAFYMRVGLIIAVGLTMRNWLIFSLFRFLKC